MAATRWFDSGGRRLAGFELQHSLESPAFSVFGSESHVVGAADALRHPRLVCNHRPDCTPNHRGAVPTGFMLVPLGFDPSRRAYDLRETASPSALEPCCLDSRSKVSCPPKWAPMRLGRTVDGDGFPPLASCPSLLPRRVPDTFRNSPRVGGMRNGEVR
jgi:hypothetical protein